MRIGSVSSMGSLYGISPYYTISSIHGNPKSLDAVDSISQQSESAKPLAIMKPVSEEEQQKIRQKQTMTAANDYETVMAQMMNGRNPENVVSDAANVQETADSFSIDNMYQPDTMERDSFNVDDMVQTGEAESDEVSVNDLQQNSVETVSPNIEFPESSEENMTDALTRNIDMAQPGDSYNYNQSGENQTFSYQMQRAIDAYTIAAGF